MLNDAYLIQSLRAVVPNILMLGAKSSIQDFKHCMSNTVESLKAFFEAYILST